MYIFFTSLSQNQFLLLKIADSNHPESGCVTDWAWTPNTFSQDSSSQLWKPRLPSLPAESMRTEPPRWSRANSSSCLTALLPHEVLAAHRSSKHPSSPACVRGLSLLSRCQCSGLEHPGAAMGAKLNCASNDCHGVALLPYPHPSHSAGCIFLMLRFIFFSFLDFHVPIGLLYFTLFWWWAWDFFVPASQKSDWDLR